MRKVTTIMQADSDFYESVSAIPINVLYLRVYLLHPRAIMALVTS